MLVMEVETFVQALRFDRGASESTVEAYCRDLQQLFSWLKKSGRVPVGAEGITQEGVAGFLAHRRKIGIGSATLARQITSYRQFFKHLQLEGDLETSPVERICSPKVTHRLPSVLTEAQARALLSAADEGFPYCQQASTIALQARDRALIYLAYATGLRCSELVGLKLDALDLKDRYVRVRGKGNKERILPFVPIAGERLRDYIEKHRSAILGDLESEYVFVGLRGMERLSKSTFWRIVRDLAAFAGIEARVSPHTLRHSFASHLLSNGMSLRSLQLLLGHASLSTTQIYTHVAPDHLKASHAKYHPRG